MLELALFRLISNVCVVMMDRLVSLHCPFSSGCIRDLLNNEQRLSTCITSVVPCFRKTRVLIELQVIELQARVGMGLFKVFAFELLHLTDSDCRTNSCKYMVKLDRMIRIEL